MNMSPDEIRAHYYQLKQQHIDAGGIVPGAARELAAKGEYAEACAWLKAVARPTSELDLDAIRDVSNLAYSKVRDQYVNADSLPSSVREHFETDVTVLIRTVNDLTSRCAALEQSKAELTAILGDTRAELHAIGGMRVIEHEGRGLKVITVALHDRLCTARVASRQDTTPPVLHCAFCGFCYPPLDTTSDQPEGGSRG